MRAVPTTHAEYVQPSASTRQTSSGEAAVSRLTAPTNWVDDSLLVCVFSVMVQVVPRPPVVKQAPNRLPRHDRLRLDVAVRSPVHRIDLNVDDLAALNLEADVLSRGGCELVPATTVRSELLVCRVRTPVV